MLMMLYTHIAYGNSPVVTVSCIFRSQERPGSVGTITETPLECNDLLYSPLECGVNHLLSEIVTNT